MYENSSPGPVLLKVAMSVVAGSKRLPAIAVAVVSEHRTKDRRETLRTENTNVPSSFQRTPKKKPYVTSWINVEGEIFHGPVCFTSTGIIFLPPPPPH